MSVVKEKTTIAIVGGGPGGLTLARLLQQSDAQVSVYERDQGRSARVQGSALDLHEDSGLAALEAAGLIDAFWANHRPDLDRLRLTDAYGRILHDHPRQMSGAGKRPEIERGPLRDILLDSLRPGTVQWDCKLESAEMQDGQVLLRFAGGKTALAGIAIGSEQLNDLTGNSSSAFYNGVYLVWDIDGTATSPVTITIYQTHGVGSVSGLFFDRVTTPAATPRMPSPMRRPRPGSSRWV